MIGNTFLTHDEQQLGELTTPTRRPTIPSPRQPNEEAAAISAETTVENGRVGANSWVGGSWSDDSCTVGFWTADPLTLDSRIDGLSASGSSVSASQFCPCLDGTDSRWA